MAAPRRKLATFRDLERLPEGTRAQVIAGELVTFSSPSVAHQGIKARVSRYVEGPFDLDGDPGGWSTLPSVDVAFTPHDIYPPDFSGWRRERVPKLPTVRPITIVPDWVCEILSPSTARYDRLQKSDTYFRSGVPFFWLVDPDARIVEAFRRTETGWLLVGRFSDGPSRIPPFDGIEIDATKLFPPAS